MKLDDDAKAWHADATLPTSLRARLSQSGAGKKRHSLPLALGYGMAAFVGIGLGVGYVSSRRLPPVTPAQSQGRPIPKTVDYKTFQQVANTIKFWREPDEQVANKKQRYEAILFTDLDCSSCKKAYPLLKKATSLRLGICQMPLTNIHSKALGKAIEAEAYQDEVGFWNYLNRAHSEISTHSESPTRAWEQNIQVQYNFVAMLAHKKMAEQRVARMRAAAQAAGVTEVPTLWVREAGASSQPMMLRSHGGIEGVKLVLETLQ